MVQPPRVVGLAPDSSPTDTTSSIVPGRKEERAAGVAGGVWVRWQEVEGVPVGLLLFPLGRQEDQEPSHLLRGLGRWGGGRDDCREHAG